MTNLTRYLSYDYQPGARGKDNKVDCWGLVRLVRAEVYGFPLMPEFAEIYPGNYRKFSAAYRNEAVGMVEVDPREGAIAACLRKGLCIHVAIVVSGNRVLEIKKRRARILRHSDWVRDYPAPLWDVRYYCNEGGSL